MSMDPTMIGVGYALGALVAFFASLAVMRRKRDAYGARVITPVWQRVLGSLLIALAWPLFALCFALGCAVDSLP